MEDRQIRCIGCGTEFTFTVKDQEFYAKNGFTDPKRCRSCRAKKKEQRAKVSNDNEPDWNGKCFVCGQSPVMPLTGMCGPCSTGEAETVAGNW